MSIDIYFTCEHCNSNVGPGDLNATHNLMPMWDAAGVCDALYESHGKRAHEIGETLTRGLTMMVSEPEKFRALNPSNGWGDYEGAVDFLRRVRGACLEHPNAVIRVCS